MQKLLVLLVGATASAYGIEVHVVNQSDWAVKAKMTLNTGKLIDQIPNIQAGKSQKLSNLESIKELSLQGMGSVTNSTLYNATTLLEEAKKSLAYISKSNDFKLCLIIRHVGRMQVSKWKVGYRFEDVKNKPNLIIKNSPSSDTALDLQWKLKNVDDEGAQDVAVATEKDLNDINEIEWLVVGPHDASPLVDEVMNIFAEKSENERAANNIMIEIENKGENLEVISKTLRAKSIPVVRPHDSGKTIKSAPALPHLKADSKVQELAIVNNTGVRLLVSYKLNKDKQSDIVEPFTNRIISPAVTNLTFEAEGFAKYNADDLLNMAKENMKKDVTQRLILKITRPGKTLSGWIVHGKVLGFPSRSKVSSTNLTMKYGGKIKQK